MKRAIMLLLLGMVFEWGELLAWAREPERPNVVVILADDLGYGDVQCYNPVRGKIATPHIDRLAAEGLRFTDAHSSSGVCSPTRYTLLTGRYHWRTRLQSGIVGVFGDPLIAPHRLTIGGLAKQKNYQTACVGKWHLGWQWSLPPQLVSAFRIPRNQDVPKEPPAIWKDVFSRPIAEGPITRGFHEYFGTDVPNWPPFCFIENDRTVGIPSVYLPQELLRDHLASLPGPALPQWRLEPILPTLADRAIGFMTRQVRAQQPFLLYLPLTTPHTPLAVNKSWKGKSGLGRYGDLVMETDAVVGQVLAAIKELGIERNSLVLFTSDNGCAPYIGVADMEKMGHFSSGPLRGYKSDAWEGGHRVPFVVRWPGVVQPGTTCDQLVHHADWFATLADLWDITLPVDAGEDSFSLLPLLKGEPTPIRAHAISQSARGLLTLREHNWKLIFGKGSGGWSKQQDSEPGQLYDLARDLGETQNLYSQQSERVASMAQTMATLVQRGRSSQGADQANDVKVLWDRRDQADAQPKTKAKPKVKPKVKPKAKPKTPENTAKG